MNLIEKLGGYERARSIANCKSGIVHPTQQLLDALLEYRREHNIFEVGDKVIYNESDFLYRVNTINSSGFHATTVHEVVRHIIAIFGHDNVRHATDVEIKAECRL